MKSPQKKRRAIVNDNGCSILEARYSMLLRVLLRKLREFGSPFFSFVGFVPGFGEVDQAVS